MEDSKRLFLLIRDWEGLIEECELGYDDSVFEFDHDCMVRDEIDEILTKSDITDPNVQLAVQCLKELDGRMKLLSHEYTTKNTLPWWKRIVLNRAGKEYVRSVKSELNLSVSPVI